MRPAITTAGGIIRCHSKAINKQRLRRRRYSESVDISGEKLHPIDSDRSNSKHEHAFKSIEEYGLLQRLFFEKSKDSIVEKSPETGRRELPFVRQIKRLREIEENRLLRPTGKDEFSFTSNQARKNLSQWSMEQSKFNQQLAGNGLSPENVDKIKYLMADSNTRIMSMTEVDNWLKFNVTFPTNSSVIRGLVRQSLTEMIKHSTVKTLPAVAEFLQNYWQFGFEGINEDAIQAKGHLIEVFTRALEIVPEAGPETSDLTSTSLNVYKELFEKFIQIYQWKNIGILYDWWLRLVAKCAPMEMAENFMYDHFIRKNKLPSREATDLFIQALIRHFDAQKLSFEGSEQEFSSLVKKELSAYRSLLISSQVTPSVIEFLLLWCTDLDEVYSVLEIASNSDHSDWIMSTCQIPMVRAVVQCTLNAEKQGPEQPALVDPKYFVPIHAKAMAHMFGVLNRFDKSGVGITPEVLDECLLLSAKYGNSAGMYRAMSMRLGLKVDNEIPTEVISQVFDQFPVSSGAMTKEAQKSAFWIINGTVVNDTRRDQVILYHLRTMIDMNVDRETYKKYIGALGRCLRSDRLYWEWKEFVSSDWWTEDVDLLLEFISANRTAGSMKAGIEILEDVVKAGIDGQRYVSAVNVLKKVLRYGALPAEMVVKEIISMLVRYGDGLKWLDEDIEGVVEEMNIPLEMKNELSLLLKSHDKSIDERISELENILHNYVY